MASSESRLNDARHEALARTNPLFGPRKLKLGTFCTNVSGAATMSTMEGVYELNWPNVMTVSRLADEMAFEAIVPLGRWQGFGGVTISVAGLGFGISQGRCNCLLQRGGRRCGRRA